MNNNAFDTTRMLTLLSQIQPLFFMKWIFALIVVFYMIFLIIVFNQIRSMDRIITQPLSSAILGLCSFLLFASSLVVLILIIRLP